MPCGEIVLVVLGILIALQINNTNELKKSETQTAAFLVRLQAEIDQNILVVQREVEKETKQFRCNARILQLFHLEIDQIKQVELDSLLFSIAESNRIKTETGTLMEGLNTGQVGLIQNDTLKRKLYGLPRNLEEISALETIDSNDTERNLVPYLYKKISFRRIDRKFSELSKYIDYGPTAFDGPDYIDLLTDREFENMIDNRLLNNGVLIGNYTVLLENFEEIRRLIHSELLQMQ